MKYSVYFATAGGYKHVKLCITGGVTYPRRFETVQSVPKRHNVRVARSSTPSTHSDGSSNNQTEDVSVVVFFLC